MAIQHKFLQKDWENGFETHNAILDVTPYKPEVLILGTFNPPTDNRPDFFYGRNFFWTALKNLFVHHNSTITQKRMHTNPLNPELTWIFETCVRLRLSFADMISEVLQHQNPVYQLLGNRIRFQNLTVSLIEDRGFQHLDAYHQVNWNIERIIHYLCANPQINQIYFTRMPVGIWQSHWEEIVFHTCMNGRLMVNLYTPSGRALHAPVMNNLLNRWVWGAPGFGHFDRHWLRECGVNPNNF
ncbi:MAG TPA: hypothetical protein PL009_08180 [Flavipsychrobacter sp.]|nr:hypothetical protein [Flavipsychrobacter sp.]